MIYPDGQTDQACHGRKDYIHRAYPLKWDPLNPSRKPSAGIPLSHSYHKHYIALLSYETTMASLSWPPSMALMSYLGRRMRPKPLERRHLRRRGHFEHRIRYNNHTSKTPTTSHPSRRSPAGQEPIKLPANALATDAYLNDITSAHPVAGQTLPQVPYSPP